MAETPRPESVSPEAERLLANITPGEWYVERKYDGGCTLAMMRDWSKGRVALAVHGPNAWIHQLGAEAQIQGNAEFIAAAPRLVRALLAERDVLREQVNEGLKAEGQKDEWVEMLSESLRSIVVAVSGNDEWEGSVADGIDLLNATFAAVNAERDVLREALKAMSRDAHAWCRTDDRDALTYLLGLMERLDAALAHTEVTP